MADSSNQNDSNNNSNGVKINLNLAPKRPKKAPWYTRLERGLKLMSELGSFVMALRDKPRFTDWLGLSMRAVDLGYRIHQETRTIAKPIDPYTPFSAKYTKGGNEYSLWTAVSTEFFGTIMKLASDGEVLREFWDGNSNSPRPVLGKIGNEALLWVQCSDDAGNTSSPCVLSERYYESLVECGRLIWENIATKHCVYAAAT